MSLHHQEGNHGDGPYGLAGVRGAPQPGSGAGDGHGGVMANVQGGRGHSGEQAALQPPPQLHPHHLMVMSSQRAPPKPPGDGRRAVGRARRLAPVPALQYGAGTHEYWDGDDQWGAKQEPLGVDPGWGPQGGEDAAMGWDGLPAWGVAPVTHLGLFQGSGGGMALEPLDALGMVAEELHGYEALGAGGDGALQGWYPADHPAAPRRAVVKREEPRQPPVQRQGLPGARPSGTRTARGCKPVGVYGPPSQPQHLPGALPRPRVPPVKLLLPSVGAAGSGAGMQVTGLARGSPPHLGIDVGAASLGSSLPQASTEPSDIRPAAGSVACAPQALKAGLPEIWRGLPLTSTGIEAAQASASLLESHQVQQPEAMHVARTRVMGLPGATRPPVPRRRVQPSGTSRSGDGKHSKSKKQSKKDLERRRRREWSMSSDEEDEEGDVAIDDDEDDNDSCSDDGEAAWVAARVKELKERSQGPNKRAKKEHEPLPDTSRGTALEEAASGPPLHSAAPAAAGDPTVAQARMTDVKQEVHDAVGPHRPTGEQERAQATAPGTDEASVAASESPSEGSLPPPTMVVGRVAQARRRTVTKLTAQAEPEQRSARRLTLIQWAHRKRARESGDTATDAEADVAHAAGSPHRPEETSSGAAQQEPAESAAGTSSAAPGTSEDGRHRRLRPRPPPPPPPTARTAATSSHVPSRLAGVRRSERQNRGAPSPVYTPEAFRSRSGRRSEGARASRRGGASGGTDSGAEGGAGDAPKAVPRHMALAEISGYPGAMDTYRPLLSRVKKQLGAMRHEEHLISVLQAEGWRGRSRERVQLTGELCAALASMERRAEAIRAMVRMCDQAPGLKPIDQACFDSDGELPIEHIFCSACKQYDCADDDDIILCDGNCRRAFHCKCVVPPVDPAEVEREERWLCPACYCKEDILAEINSDFDTDYTLDTPWKEVLELGPAGGGEEHPVLNAPWINLFRGDQEPEDSSKERRGSGGAAARADGSSGGGSEREGGTRRRATGRPRRNVRRPPGGGVTLADLGGSEDEVDDEDYVGTVSSGGSGGGDAGSRGGSSASRDSDGNGSGSGSSGESDASDGDSDDDDVRLGAGVSGSIDGDTAQLSDSESPGSPRPRKRRRAAALAVDYVTLNERLFGVRPGRARSGAEQGSGRTGRHVAGDTSSDDEDYTPDLDSQ